MLNLMSDYDLFAEKYHLDAKENLLKSNSSKLCRDLIDRANLNINQINHLLIVGGASGIEVQYIAKNLENVNKITSIDVSKELIKLAKSEYPHPKISYIVAQYLNQF